MLDARTRLARAMAEPALTRLHRRLSRLKSVLTVMNTGAHPDDEANGLLAALRFEHGMRIVVACSTRGEGGQNALGPERGAALGVLRTAEMEEAARRIDADVAWLGHGPDDPVHDFGFSKNGDDTLRRWGEERIVERLVRAYRRYRPDIVIPTFLDVPGQHGHHRAMTRAAEAAFDLASDPSAFSDHAEQGLRPWQVSKFYLPAWSGASYAYDDETPPPPTTLTIHIGERDRVSGLAYRQVGEWSRAAHASQGMGIWRDDAVDRWELHLKRTATGRPGGESDIRDRLPATLNDVANSDGLTQHAADALREAQEHILAAETAFPARDRICGSLSRAARLIEVAKEGLDDEVADRIGHRLNRKLRELDAVMFETGTNAAWAAFKGNAQPGARVELDVRIDAPAIADLTVTPRLPAGLDAVEVSRDAALTRYTIDIPETASLTGNYPEAFDPMGGNGAAGLLVSGTIGKRRITIDLDPEEPFRIEPAHSVSIEPDIAIIRTKDATSAFKVKVMGDRPVDWRIPDGWRVRSEDDASLVEPPRNPGTGLSTLVPVVDGRPAAQVHAQVQSIAYPHIRATSFHAPVELKVLTLDVALPDNVRIGYVGGGSDNVGIHLRRLGLDVTDLDEADLTVGTLSEFTTIVVGIFTFGLRNDLRLATGRLHSFVESGGHLLTLYHRPTDGWVPDATPPRRLVIGSPSLRWRVTDPAAKVTLLKPEHPLLNRPNRIGPDDWENWDKERGLYFASTYDPVYEELISLNDPGESPLNGALVSARIGRGRHTHTSLVLHHQMDKLVPGAFRLMANLVQPA